MKRVIVLLIMILLLTACSYHVTTQRESTQEIVQEIPIPQTTSTTQKNMTQTVDSPVEK
ncbi:MAG TPA: hypothetical protein VKE88_01765 [Candidatus Nanoarchaeia archaeon]|nr:hypothetical protein [Candidatus Nanoarchaeia archaeon]